MGKATPTAQQQHLVALWRESTISQAAFARSHGVRPGTFSSWVARHRQTPALSPGASAFVELMSAPVASSVRSFVVHVDELALRFDAPPPPGWFAAVLRELAPC